jgi:hypothetical protein
MDGRARFEFPFLGSRLAPKWRDDLRVEVVREFESNVDVSERSPYLGPKPLITRLKLNPDKPYLKGTSH